jgi:terminal uridylyltransferase
MECDIAFYNPLALCNTRLLRTYSMCDPRVRPLAYFIKHWVKCRGINNPAEGTLGSYGYILSLIHFLQVTIFILKLNCVL